MISSTDYHVLVLDLQELLSTISTFNLHQVFFLTIPSKLKQVQYLSYFFGKKIKTGSLFFIFFWKKN